MLSPARLGLHRLHLFHRLHLLFSRFILPSSALLVFEVCPILIVVIASGVGEELQLATFLDVSHSETKESFDNQGRSVVH